MTDQPAATDPSQPRHDERTWAAPSDQPREAAWPTAELPAMPAAEPPRPSLPPLHDDGRPAPSGVPDPAPGPPVPPPGSWAAYPARSGPEAEYLVDRLAPGGVGAAPRRRRSGAAALATVTSGVLLVGLLGGFAGSWLFDRTQTRETASLPVASASAPAAAASGVAASAGSRPAGSVAAVATRVLPSVVAIRVTGSAGQGTGSGFVIDGAGHILTNNHVVALAADGGTIKVLFDDGSQKDATVIGTDVSYDLAVIKADTGSRAALALGNSDQVVVGDPVIAIGAPLGLQGTVTTGIVSAKNRPVSAGEPTSTDQSYINAIQTDAAINPGNSGGPLVDASGTVIGVNSAIARVGASTGGTGGNIGVGFAIPSNQARRTATQLIEKGKAEHPVIGVSLDDRYDGEGVRVADAVAGGVPAVRPGGPADRAGLKPGDVITAVDGRPVTTPSELIVAVRAKAVGDTATLSVRRGGSDLTLTVTLAAGTG